MQETQYALLAAGGSLSKRQGKLAQSCKLNQAKRKRSEPANTVVTVSGWRVQNRVEGVTLAPPVVTMMALKEAMKAAVILGASKSLGNEHTSLVTAVREQLDPAAL